LVLNREVDKLLASKDKEIADLKAKIAKAYDKIDEMAIDEAAWSTPFPKEWGVIYQVPETAFKELKRVLKGGD
jgi:hypothetical protein